MAGQEENIAKDWHFIDDTDKALGVETKIYTNEHEVKRFTSSKGQEVLVRELNGSESMLANKIAAGDSTKVIPAIMHLAVTVNGKQLPMEDFEKLRAKDFNKIHMQTMILNF